MSKVYYEINEVKGNVVRESYPDDFFDEYGVEVVGWVTLNTFIDEKEAIAKLKELSKNYTIDLTNDVVSYLELVRVEVIDEYPLSEIINEEMEYKVIALISYIKNTKEAKKVFNLDDYNAEYIHKDLTGEDLDKFAKDFLKTNDLIFTKGYGKGLSYNMFLYKGGTQYEY